MVATPLETLKSAFSEEVDSALGLLLRRELIERGESGYSFQVELVRRWFAA